MTEILYDVLHEKWTFDFNDPGTTLAVVLCPDFLGPYWSHFWRESAVFAWRQKRLN